MKGKQKLREYLDDNGMKQDHLAKKLKISKQRLWSLLTRPNSQPSIDLAVRIAQFTNNSVKVEDWVNLDEIEKKTSK